jgi:hypothetical protein
LVRHRLGLPVVVEVAQVSAIKHHRAAMEKAFDLADTIRRAEQHADIEPAAARRVYIGESELIAGLRLAVYEDPLPQEHPTQRAFRDGALWAFRYLQAGKSVPQPDYLMTLVLSQIVAELEAP